MAATAGVAGAAPAAVVIVVDGTSPLVFMNEEFEKFFPIHFLHVPVFVSNLEEIILIAHDPSAEDSLAGPPLLDLAITRTYVSG